MAAKSSKAGGGDAKEGAAGMSAPLYLVFGDDEYRAATRAREIVGALCPAAEQDLGLEVVDGSARNSDEALAAIRRCIEAVRTLGFFGGRKVVWLRDATFFHDGEPGRFEDVKAAVGWLTDEIKAGLPEGNTLVITAAKVDGRSAFYKACKAAGAVEPFNIETSGWKAAEQASGFARQLFAEAGLRVGEGALASFLDRCGLQSRQIAQEVEKVSLYLGDRKEVAVGDIRAIVSPTREAAGWDLADAFGQRDVAAALGVLRQLAFQKVAPHVMLLGIMSRIRELMAYRECLDQGWVRMTGDGKWAKAEWAGPESAAAKIEAVLGRAPGAVHSYRLKVLCSQARGFDPAELARCHGLAVEAYERLITGAADGDVLVELFLIKTLGGESRAA